MKNYNAKAVREMAIAKDLEIVQKELDLANSHYEITVQGAIIRNCQKRKLTYTVPTNINKRMLINIIKEDGYKVEKVFETKKRFLRKPLKIETNKILIQW